MLLPRDVALKAYVDQWLHQAIESGAFARANEQWLAYPWGIESLRALIDARLLLAPDVAQFKWNHHVPIEDLPREAQVIAALGHRASDLGVPQAVGRGVLPRADRGVEDGAERAVPGLGRRSGAASSPTRPTSPP